MTDLEFRTSLSLHPFKHSNEFVLYDRSTTGLLFGKRSKDILYITRGGHMTTNELIVSQSKQFNGRFLSSPKISEILNSSPLPLKIGFSGLTYFIGKGFVAIGVGRNYKVLFAATHPNPWKPVYDMDDIKLYVSKSLYSPEHKAILGVIKEVMKNHVGDVIITPDVNGALFLGLPVITGSISERRTFTSKLIKECVSNLRIAYGFAEDPNKPAWESNPIFNFSDVVVNSIAPTIINWNVPPPSVLVEERVDERVDEAQVLPRRVPREVADRELAAEFLQINREEIGLQADTDTTVYNIDEVLSRYRGAGNMVADAPIGDTATAIFDTEAATERIAEVVQAPSVEVVEEESFEEAVQAIERDHLEDEISEENDAF